MKVIDSIKEFPFGALNNGDLFEHPKDETPCIKIESFEPDDSNTLPINAVSLKFGMTHRYEDSVMIKPIKGSLMLEGYYYHSVEE